MPPACPLVMVVSDDPLLRELVADLLRRDRFEVSEAGDPSEAAALARHTTPAVVLLDAIVDGVLARPVLRAPEEVFGADLPRLVVLAGAGTPADVRSHEGVDEILLLPLTAEGLARAIGHHATWHGRRQMRSGTHARANVIMQAPGRAKGAL